MNCTALTLTDFGKRPEYRFDGVLRLLLLTVTFCLGLALKAGAQTRVILPEERDLVVFLYERENPEAAENIDAFFSVEDLSACKEDVLNIKYLIYTSDREIREAFGRNLGKLSFINMVGEPYYTGGIYKTVCADLSGAAADPRGPYVTFFHECAHGIEDLEGPLWAGVSNPELSAEYTSAVITTNFNQKMTENYQIRTKKC